MSRKERKIAGLSILGVAGAMLVTQPSTNYMAGLITAALAIIGLLLLED